jgi:integrase
MSRSKGPRLYLDPTRRDWCIRDGTIFKRTGFAEHDRVHAEQRLAEHIGAKYQPTPSAAPLIVSVLLVYAKEAAPHCKTSANIGRIIVALSKSSWGEKHVSDITVKSCRAYAATMTGPAARAHLKTLRSAVKFWHASEYGPLTVMPAFWLPPENPPRERWLTVNEAARLLKAAKPSLHLRRFILLALHTGSRPGVVFGLTWAHVDLEHGIMRRTLGAQDTKKRAPTIRLGRKILGHLRRWKRLDGPNARVICHFDGRAVFDPHASWERALRVAGLEGVTRHTLRHTRATWTMQRGVDLWQAAGFLGMSTKTLEKVYGHHSPAHQEGAANI